MALRRTQGKKLVAMAIVAAITTTMRAATATTTRAATVTTMKATIPPVWVKT